MSDLSDQLFKYRGLDSSSSSETPRRRWRSRCEGQRLSSWLRVLYLPARFETHNIPNHDDEHRCSDSPRTKDKIASTASTANDHLLPSTRCILFVRQYTWRLNNEHGISLASTIRHEFSVASTINSTPGSGSLTRLPSQTRKTRLPGTYCREEWWLGNLGRI